jgi:hypothetical protein
MRLLVAALLAATPLFGCSCLNTASACSAMGGSTVVFLGRVLVDSGEGWGTGPARVLIEEELLNVPKDLHEVEIHTSAGTSCYYRLKQGERYVIFAQKLDGVPVRLAIGACSNTFQLEGNGHVLDALRNKSRAGPSTLVGTVRRSSGSYSNNGVVAGASIVAQSATNRYEALSNASGAYQLWGVVPDRYQLEVTKPGFVPDQKFNQRWSGRLIANEATKTIGPDETEPRGSVLIGARSCEVWDLSMWPRGRISGTVRSATGEPLSGLTVQAFAFDKKNKRESSPLRTGKTDDLGRYTIEPLPGGEYVIGVNAETYRDMDPYPPTVFRRDKDSSDASRVMMADGAETPNIDFVMPAKRVATTLKVQVTGPGGGPYAGATVTLKNLAGVERWDSTEETSREGIIEIPVYIGEQYVVGATAFDVAVRGKDRKYDYLGGSSRVDITKQGATVLVVLVPKRFSEER